jgi:hypothetical protein
MSFQHISFFSLGVDRLLAVSTARPQRSEDGLRAAAPQALPPATNRGGKVLRSNLKNNSNMRITA